MGVGKENMEYDHVFMYSSITIHIVLFVNNLEFVGGVNIILW